MILVSQSRSMVLFGDQTALSKGIVFRVEKNENVRINKGNFKDNGDIADACYDLTYSTRSGGQGSYGLRARYTLTKEGNSTMLYGKSNDVVKLIIQDNLSSLVEFNCTLAITDIPV